MVFLGNLQGTSITETYEWTLERSTMVQVGYGRLQGDAMTCDRGLADAWHALAG